MLFSIFYFYFYYYYNYYCIPEEMHDRQLRLTLPG